MYIIPTGATVTHSTSIMPPKAKVTARKVKKHRRNRRKLRYPNATKAISALTAILIGNSKYRGISGKNITSPYRLPISAPKSSLRLDILFFTIIDEQRSKA